MMRKRKTHPDLRGELGRIVAGAEQPDRRQRRIVRHRHHIVVRVAGREIAGLPQGQLMQPLQKIVALAAIEPAAQRVGRGAVGAGRAAKAEIDAAGKQRLQHLEALGDDQRRVVGQHHPAGADADVLGHWRRSARSSGRARGSRPTPDCGARQASSGHSRGHRHAAPGRCCCAAPRAGLVPVVTTERSRTESGIMAVKLMRDVGLTRPRPRRAGARRRGPEAGFRP